MYWIGVFLAFAVFTQVVKKSQRILFSDDVFIIGIMSLGSWATLLGIIMSAVYWKVKRARNPSLNKN